MLDNDELKKDNLITLSHYEFMNNGVSGQHLKTFNALLDGGFNDIVKSGFGTMGCENLQINRNITDEDKSIKSISFKVEILDWNVQNPKYITHNLGVNSMLTPNIARKSDLTYSSQCTMSVRLSASAELHDGSKKELKPVEILNYPIGNLPIMVGSNKCNTYNMTKLEMQSIEEDITDNPGYFIIKGKERVLDALENVAVNKYQVHKNFYLNEIVRCEFISKHGIGFENSSQIRIKYLKGGAITLEIVIGKLKEINIPFYLMYRLFGMTRDCDIMQTVVYDINSTNPIIKNMMKLLKRAMEVSIKKGKKSTETDTGENSNDINSTTTTETTETNEENDNIDDSFQSVINSVDISKIINKIWDKMDRGKLKNNINNQKYINIQVMKLLDTNFLPHIGKTEESRYAKLLYFGYLINTTLSVLLDLQSSTDRDSEKNKRIHAAGITYAKAFKTQFNINIYLTIKSHLIKAFNNEEFSKVNLVDVYKNAIKNSKDLETGMIKSMSDSKNKIKIGNKEITNRVSSKVMDRRNSLAQLSMLRSVSAPGGSASKQSERSEKIRSIHPSFYNGICIIQTQENGEDVGMNKQLGYAATVTEACSPHKIIELLLNEKSCIPLQSTYLPDIINYTNSNGVVTGLTKIFVNGYWLVNCTDPNYIIRKYRYLRRNNIDVNPTISIYKEEMLNEIHFWTDNGRLTTPCIVVYNNLYDGVETYNESTGEFTPFLMSNVTEKDVKKFEQYIKLTKQHIKDLISGKINVDYLHKNGIVEYIDKCEADNTYFAYNINELQENKNNFYKQYTHLEIEQNLFGIPALTSPFIERSPPNRTAFQTSQSRQTCGWYSLMFPFRTDKNAFHQFMCEMPLAKTVANNYCYPNGFNCIVAVLSDDGYNQEDSQKGRKGPLDRGLFGGLFINTVSETLDKGEFFGKPDPMNTLNIKERLSYSNIGDNGLPKKGTIIKKNDIIIGKFATLNEQRGTFKYIDKSVKYQQNEDIKILNSFKSYNSEGKEIAKVVTIAYRPMETGDKTSARSGCKGILSFIANDYDMAYTEDGIIPDLCINPSTFPSRMVVNQIEEMVISSCAAEKGSLFDCTAFKDLNILEISNLAKVLGLSPTGKRRMFNGITGEHIDAEIYIGMTYYQRLQKFIKNDSRANANAPINITTRQPNKGIGKGGMSRLGEMEKDIIASHDSAHILSERWYTLSDGHKIPYCNNCKFQCIINEAKNYFTCKICDNKADIRIVNSSWTAKYFDEHLQAAHIKMERIMEPICFEEYQ